MGSFAKSFRELEVYRESMKLALDVYGSRGESFPAPCPRHQGYERNTEPRVMANPIAYTQSHVICIDHEQKSGITGFRFLQRGRR